MSARLIGLVLTNGPGMLVKHGWSSCVLCWDHMVLLTTHLDAYDKIAYDARVLLVDAQWLVCKAVTMQGCYMTNDAAAPVEIQRCIA